MALVRWLWDFGDGEYSNEGNPVHTYFLPGTYTVTCTAWDEYGNEYTLTKEDYIVVSPYPIALLSTNTDFCFRHAVRPKQGQGIMPVSGRWVWPPLIAATAKGINSSNDSVSLVINADNMKIYRIGIPELWTDRAGDYDESEIACEAMLPEIKSRNGEHENVRHIETHASMVPYDEKTYRGADGYDSDGFRDGHEISLEAYEGGEQIVPTTKLRSVNKNGDYSFLKEVESRRFQLKFLYSTSAFRTTRIECHAQEIDHRTPPQLNNIPEKVWQRQFASMDIWFSRNKPTIYTSRANGGVWTGEAIYAAGPDGKGSSAFVSSGLTEEIGYSISDFTISGWMIGNGRLFSATVAGSGEVSIVVAAGVLTFTDGTDTAMIDIGESSSWRLITVVRDGSTLELYVNGLLRMSQELTAVRSYGGDCTVAVGTFFDVRRILRAIGAEALYYYYEMVLDGGGGFLP